MSENKHFGKVYINEREGCKKFSCSRNTFRKIADEAGATIKISSRNVRFDEEILDAYMNSLRTNDCSQNKF